MKSEENILEDNTQAILTALQAMCANYRQDLTEEMMATWSAGLQDLTPNQIAVATLRTIKSLSCEYPPYFPKIAQFRELVERVEPGGAFQSQLNNPEWKGLPEPDWVHEERHEMVKKNVGKLVAMVKSGKPIKKAIPYKHTGIENGRQFEMWRDDEGLDWVYFHDHPANNRPEEWKTEAPKRESEKDRYERVKRAHGYE